MRKKDGECRQYNFWKGAAMLSLSVIIVKIIGAIFKIPLTNLIGALGIGYFNTAYQLYLPVYTIAVAGVPVALSALSAQAMSDNTGGDIKRLFRLSLPFFIVSGLLGSFLLYFGARQYSVAIHNAEAVYCIQMLAPALFFCCVMAVFRGYFEGLGNMLPTAFSQVLEAVGKLFLGLFGASFVLRLGWTQYEQSGVVFGRQVFSEEDAFRAILPYGACGAVFGVTVGAFLGMSWMIIYYFFYAKRCPHAVLPFSRKSNADLRKQLVHTALPVCAGALAINIGTLVDVTFLQRALGGIPISDLKSAYDGALSFAFSAEETTTFLYGAYCIAQNLAMLIPSFAQALGTSALPSVTAAWTKAKRGNIAPLQKEIHSVLSASCAIAFPCGLGLCSLSREILQLLFPGQPNSVAVAIPFLRLLSLAAILMTLSIPINSMLQAVEKSEFPVYFLLSGMIVKLLINYFIVPVPQVNLLGACIGSLICYALIFILGLQKLIVHTKIKPVPSVFFLPLIGGGLCAGSAKLTSVFLTQMHLVPAAIGTVLAVAVGGTVYFLFLLRFGTFSFLPKLPFCGTIKEKKS